MVSPASVLTDQDAWAIAMAWRPFLQGKVRLVTDREGPVRSLVESYAWVRIDDVETSAMRGAMLTWTALASCPGFSGNENPTFWKRLFSELQEDYSWRSSVPSHGCMLHSGDELAPVTDAHSFFNEVSGHKFPRFMVTTPYPVDETLLRVFAVDPAPSTCGITDDLLARLRPFQQCVSSEPIDVCLRVYPFFSEGEGHALAAYIRTINSTGAMPSRFRVCRIQFRDSFQLGGLNTPKAFLDFARETPLTIPEFNFLPLLDKLSRESRADWVRAFLRLDGSGVQLKLESFSVARHSVSSQVFQTLMGSLPFAQSIHSLRLGTERLEGGFEHFDLPWIAYAIFHPHTSSSSWCHLDLDEITITEHAKYVLTAMARGNNLLALLNRTVPTSDAYYNARLEQGTVVRVKPDETSERLVTASHDDFAVDVCGIDSLDPSSWGNWIAVIVPAYGLGYVLHEDLLDVQSHAPCTDHPFGLVLRRKYNYNNDVTDDAPEVLRHVLEPLGAMLIYLKIDSYSDISSSTLREMLRVCPSLKVLVASHDGEFWSDEEAHSTVRDTDQPLGLDELELSVRYHQPRVAEPSPQLLKTMLRNLRALRFRVFDLQIDQLTASRSTLDQLLVRLQLLQYLHWQHVGADYTWRDRTRPIPYANSMEWTPKALGELGLTAPKHLYAHQALSQAGAIAFLSVIDRKRSSCAPIVRLDDRSVLTNIFQFATSRTLRRIHIEPITKRGPP